MIIQILMLILFGVLAGLGSFLIGLMVWIVLTLFKKALHLDIKINTESKSN